MKKVIREGAAVHEVIREGAVVHEVIREGAVVHENCQYQTDRWAHRHRQRPACRILSQLTWMIESRQTITPLCTCAGKYILCYYIISSILSSSLNQS